MPRLFAIADLHLSETGQKPMDRFGDLWHDHARRMADAWDEDVGPDDTVLVAGDISWARNPAEAEPDMAWLAARPGRKLVLKGNHDSWWGSPSKVRRLLPPCCTPLHHDAHEAHGVCVLGARGWLAPDDPWATPEDAPVFRRELERLDLSIKAASRDGLRGLPRIAMTHYPPWLLGREPTAVVPRLRRAGVRLCVYGHLHGEDHALALRGEAGGIDWRFVAADAVGFRPVELPLERLLAGETP